MPRSLVVLRSLALALLLSALASWGLAFDKQGTVYTTDGSQKDVKAAIADAQDGDTVVIPPGTFTYGTKKDVIGLPKAITLAGSGRDKTTIVIADSSGNWTNAAIRLWGPATIRDFTVRGAAVGNRTPFAAGKAKGWRITNIEFVQTEGKGSYFLYAQSGFGLVDNCIINGAAGNNELIFTRGPADAWQTDSTIGTADNVYIEDCVFNGRGYVCDINANGKAVVRFCTINGPNKVDGHGKASNTPPRGVRHMEIYNNTWTHKGRFWLTVEMRGGTGHIFNNKAAGGSFMLRDYAYSAKWPNFGKRFRTPKDYPIDDQIGVGKDPKRGGSEPLYVWNNRMADGTPWPRSNRKAPAEAIKLYNAPAPSTAAAKKKTAIAMDPDEAELAGKPKGKKQSLGKPFFDSDLIAQDRDFFRQVESFDGSSGMGVGTRAQMDAIKPTRLGVGFWVTDEGDWNKKTPGPDGRLYVWNGKAWILKYTPYTYPHPLRAKDNEKSAP